MMKAEIRRFHSPDAMDLDSWAPEDKACFGIVVQAIIGPKDGIGEESFDFVICSPKWLEAMVSKAGSMLVRHHLLVQTFDLAEVKETIGSVVRGADGQDWIEIANKIARYGKWEFEDYMD